MKMVKKWEFSLMHTWSNNNKSESLELARKNHYKTIMLNEIVKWNRVTLYSDSEGERIKERNPVENQISCFLTFCFFHILVAVGSRVYFVAAHLKGNYRYLPLSRNIFRQRKGIRFLCVCIFLPFGVSVSKFPRFMLFSNKRKKIHKQFSCV